MGREQRRKEAKKNGTSIKGLKENKELNSGVEGKVAIKITIVVVAIFAILYLVLAIFVTKELDLSTNKENKTEDNSNTTVSNAILAVDTFRQSEETYYVLFYGFNNEDEKSIESTVTSGLTDSKVYKVDTESGLNKNYVADVSNPSVTSIENLKVKSPTLMQISADSVIQYIEGKDNIESYLAK